MRFGRCEYVCRETGNMHYGYLVFVVPGYSNPSPKEKESWMRCLWISFLLLNEVSVHNGHRIGYSGSPPLA